LFANQMVTIVIYILYYAIFNFFFKFEHLNLKYIIAYRRHIYYCIFVCWIYLEGNRKSRYM